MLEETPLQTHGNEGRLPTVVVSDDPADDFPDADFLIVTKQA